MAWFTDREDSQLSKDKLDARKKELDEQEERLKKWEVKLKSYDEELAHRSTLMNQKQMEYHEFEKKKNQNAIKLVRQEEKLAYQQLFRETESAWEKETVKLRKDIADLKEAHATQIIKLHEEYAQQLSDFSMDNISYYKQGVEKILPLLEKVINRNQRIKLQLPDSDGLIGDMEYEWNDDEEDTEGNVYRKDDDSKVDITINNK